MNSIDICNQALLRIGAAEIASLTEQAQEAMYCSRFYGLVRQASLRQFPWNFAAVVEELAQLAEDPGDWEYAYQLPAGCLRVLGLVEAVPFEVRGRRVVTDSETCTLRYTSDIEDVNQWDPLFADAVAYRLAAELAMPITGKPALAQAMGQQADQAFARARQADCQEQQSAGFTGNFTTFTDARE